MYIVLSYTSIRCVKNLKKKKEVFEAIDGGGGGRSSTIKKIYERSSPNRAASAITSSIAVTYNYRGYDYYNFR